MEQKLVSFGKRKFMTWKMSDEPGQPGTLMVMDDLGKWRPYTLLYTQINMPVPQEYFEGMSKGYGVMQQLLKRGYQIVRMDYFD